jgi:DNA-binding transcriptional ArsR family regulator
MRTSTPSVTAGDVDVEEVAKVLAAAGDPTRVRLLQLLLTGEHCVARCAESIGVAPLALSRHLRTLTDTGLLTERADGSRRYYRVTEPTIVARLLTDAESLLSEDS